MADDTQDAVVNPAETPSAPPSGPAVAAPVAPPAALADAAPSFVYALGQIEARFPSLSIEKEYAQVRASTDYAGATDREALIGTISNPENRYLARNMCWVLIIEGLETYILVPRDPRDLEFFIDAYRAEPRRDDLDVVIGVRGGVAPPEMCNGLAIPVVVVDLVYSFDRESLISAIPRPESITEKDDAKFRSAAGALFDEITQLADNAGAIDEHRALNYLTVRYPRIYAVSTEQYNRNFAFTGVQVTPSRLSGVRKIVDVVFSYTHRETDVVEKQFVRVDVTEQFPFLVTKMCPYYDR
jgi:PatG C-terminal